MISVLYFVAFLIVLVLTVQVSYSTMRGESIYYFAVVSLCSVACFGYFVTTIASDMGEALIGNHLMYLDSSFIPVLLLFAIMEYSKLRVTRLLKFIMYTLATIKIILAWTIEYNQIYYKSIVFVKDPNGSYIVSTRGPLFFIHFCFLGLVAAAAITLIIYGYRHRNKVSYRNTTWILVALLISLIFYTIQFTLHMHYSFMPCVYVLYAFMMLVLLKRVRLYNVDNVATMMHHENQRFGYFAFDMQKRYLGCNEIAQNWLPWLGKLNIDCIPNMDVDRLKDIFQWIDEFDKGNRKDHFLENDGCIYKYSISYLYVNKKQDTKGYLVELQDDTEQQRNIQLLANYNERLQEDVERQTEHVQEIQKRVVLGLANMIENRDYSTGGHVKRTSDVIKIFVQTIRDNNMLPIDAEFAEDIIRAAPMHDLGKIAVDNSILNKPGRLTEEEFAIMRSHAPKSGEIVEAILTGVEEDHFVRVAHNVARHHHERWDGNGYPDRLQGNAIPLEARIMSIADVYDALVSKRVYKEAMSFEKAYQVMIENMGSQFDPKLEQAFILSREKFEEYYQKANSAEE